MASFSQRHYEKIADVLRTERLYLDDGKDSKAIYELGRVSIKLAYMFKADNPRFQLDRFHRACQP